MKLKYIMALAASIVLASCVDKWEDPLKGKGTRELRYSVDEFSIVTFKPFSTETKDLFTIYRDEISNSTSDQTVAVTMEISADSLAAYNAANDTEFLIVPPGAYTLNIPAGTVTFGPGESAKTVTITLNTGLLDLTQKYVLPFVIKDATNGSSVQSSLAIVQTLPINKYDGVYEVTEGEMIDVANATLQHINVFRHSAAAADVGIVVGSNQLYALVTTGEFSDDVFDFDFFGNYYMPITSAATYSRYGDFAPQFVFDTDDVIVEVTNYYGQPAGNARYAEVDPDAANQWSTGGIEDVGYFMFQPTVIAGVRTTWSETWEYVEPRP